MAESMRLRPPAWIVERSPLEDFEVGGYTLDFIKQMQEVQKKMAAQPDGEALDPGDGDQPAPADDSDPSGQGLDLRQDAQLHRRGIRAPAAAGR